ncbi:MAG: hypothetical protein RL318_795, partial [Fibrobacterota bacterium]
MASFLERYHELTKYDPRTIDRLGAAEWEEQPSPWKEISGEEKIDVRPYLAFLQDAASEPENWIPPIPTGQLDVASLARLSWFAAGINGIGGDPEKPQLYRTTPSAGGLYPVELYWAVFDVPGMDPGIWLFHAPTFTMVPVWKGDFRNDIKAIFLDHPSLEGAGAVALLTGIFGRGRWRYKERTWRRMLLDAGHLGANLMEAVEKNRLTGAFLTGFVDEAFEGLLFPEPGEVPLAGVPVGLNLATGAPWAVKSPALESERTRVVPEPGRMQELAHALGNIPPDEHPDMVPDGEWVQGDGLEYVPLPDPVEPRNLLLANVLRRSCRRYQATAEGISLDLFSCLVHWAFRPAATRQSPAPAGTLRFWIAVLSVEGLQSGIWHYDPSTHSMGLCSAGNYRKECQAVCLGQELGRDASFVVFHTSVLSEA